jgi:MFS family permease
MSRIKIVRIASTVALGGFLVGFDATVISGAVPFLREYFSLGGTSGSLSSADVSCSAGVQWPGILRRKVERPVRPQKRAAADSSAISRPSLAAALAASFAVFVAARICGGLAVRAAIPPPVYIAEIAPARNHGSLVSSTS